MKSLDTTQEQNTDIRINDLVTRIQSGQTEAFSLLYEEYLNRIYRYIYVRIGVVEQAEDITQEVFLRAYKSISNYRCQGKPFLAWLVRIAHNLVVDYHRRGDRFRFVHLFEQVAVSEGDPVNIVESNYGLTRLREAIARLPPAQKEAVTPRLVAGLSIAETAYAMGKSEGAIKALQHDGTRNLRKMLEKG